MKCDAHVLSPSQILSIPSAKVQQERKVRIVVRTKLCRHCRRRLPLFRSLFKSIFCNRAHEREYLKSMEELALERLKASALRLNLASHRAMTAALADPPAMA